MTQNHLAARAKRARSPSAGPFRTSPPLRERGRGARRPSPTRGPERHKRGRLLLRPCVSRLAAFLFSEAGGGGGVVGNPVVVDLDLLAEPPGGSWGLGGRGSAGGRRGRSGPRRTDSLDDDELPEREQRRPLRGAPQRAVRRGVKQPGTLGAQLEELAVEARDR